MPGFGASDARIAILGLAPAAHGGNRTGRIFTGDRSGDVLFAALYRAGLANQPTSVAADDGLPCSTPDLRRGALRAAGQQAHPGRAGHLRARTSSARSPCSTSSGSSSPSAPSAGTPPSARSPSSGTATPSPKPRFAHGAETTIGPYTLLGTYHPSQQNVYTGRLTAPMLDDVLRRASELAGVLLGDRRRWCGGATLASGTVWTQRLSIDLHYEVR